jgi:hypothetical protein
MRIWGRVSKCECGFVSGFWSVNAGLGPGLDWECGLVAVKDLKVFKGGG